MTNEELTRVLKCAVESAEKKRLQRVLSTVGLEEHESALQADLFDFLDEDFKDLLQKYVQRGLHWKSLENHIDEVRRRGLTTELKRLG